jgi:thioredoxin-related protein
MTSFKRTLFLFVFTLCFTAIYAQAKVNFITQGNLRTVFDLAKAQHKKVFLEVYSPDCHICKALEPSFSNAEVAKYYNSNFISYRLDANKMETLAFLQKQKVYIQSTPTLLFYDEDVKLIYKSTLTEQKVSAEILLSEAKKAIVK